MAELLYDFPFFNIAVVLKLWFLHLPDVINYPREKISCFLKLAMSQLISLKILPSSDCFKDPFSNENFCFKHHI